MKLPIVDELDSPSIYVHVHNAGIFQMELPIVDDFDSQSLYICTYL